MLVSKKHKKVVLNLRTPERVLEVIPTAKEFEYKGRRLVAVPHRLEEVRVLRNIGFDVPGPILSQYDWPGQHKPFAHQIDTANFLTLHPRAFCLNDMGTGKTLSVLWAYDFLRQANVIGGSMLVIAPLSTLERTWADEVWRHFPHLTVSVLHGTQARRLALLEQGADVLVINHDGIKSPPILDALSKAVAGGKINVVAADELAAFRNSTTDRWKALRNLTKEAVFLWGMTGTPIPNAPTDAYAQVKLVNPNRVPRMFNQFRDAVMKQISKFKWVPREGALDYVFDVMQPAIRYPREACIDLPPTMHQTRQIDLTPDQKRLYADMLRKLRAEHEQGQITALNEAVKMAKLLQIACLKYDTPVLTRRGWVEIRHVCVSDLVWDGHEWVSHAGSVFRGVKPVMVAGDIQATKDHLVLSTRGWKPYKEFVDGHASKRFGWAEVRLPDGVTQSGYIDGKVKKSSVGVQVRLWKRGRSGKSVSTRQAQNAPKELRLRARQSNAWNDQHAAVSCLVRHAKAVSVAARQRLGQLRKTWNRCVRPVGSFVRSVLQRYAHNLSAGFDAWANRQQRPLLAGELSVGDGCPAGQQPQNLPPHQHTQRTHDGVGGSSCLWSKASNAVCASGSLWVAGAESLAATYDLVDCGPRNQFVVRGQSGQPRIVHNCGVSYSDSGEVVVPAKPRLEALTEIIEEAGSKVIVFVPFRGALSHVAAHVEQSGYSVGMVHGGVSKTERDLIFGNFQKAQHPRVIVAQPGTMSHGLNLTAASTIVFFAPITSNDIYQQACARIVRPGQKLNTLIVHIEGCEVERRIYDRLQKKGATQGVLLEMFDG